MHFTRPSARSRHGFTLVEVLVAIGIVAVLLGLLLPALSAAKKRGYKTRELNNIKNLGQAWLGYGNSNNDAALPGFLEVPVQEKQVMGVSRGWGVSYKLPDNNPVPLSNDNLTGPWTWRLLSYIGFNHRLIHEHLEESHPDATSLLAEGKTVAYEPAFGYNGLYIGGWWQMRKLQNVDTPYARYTDHCIIGTTSKAVTVPTTLSQIARTSDMVAFCSTTLVNGTGTRKKFDSTTPGHHLATPPMLEGTERWRPSKGDPINVAEVVEPGTSLPVGRYTGTIAVLYADGHVDSQGYNALNDMRKWANDATDDRFAHAPCATTD